MRRLICAYEIAARPANRDRIFERINRARMQKEVAEGECRSLIRLPRTEYLANAVHIIPGRAKVVLAPPETEKFADIVLWASRARSEHNKWAGLFRIGLGCFPTLIYSILKGNPSKTLPNLAKSENSLHDLGIMHYHTKLGTFLIY